MPFDDKKYYAPAQASDVARVALSCSIAIDQIIAMFAAQSEGDNDEFARRLQKLMDQSERLHKFSIGLTGYTDAE